ncbi:hypothetical protein ACWKWP_03360 [Agromyces soli]
MSMDDETRIPEEEPGSYVDSELPEDAVVPDEDRRVDDTVIDADDIEYDEDELGATQPLDRRTAAEPQSPPNGPEPLSDSTDGGLDGGDPGVEE